MDFKMSYHLTPSARVPSTQGRSLADIYRVPASEFIIDNTEFSHCDLRILPFFGSIFVEVGSLLQNKPTTMFVIVW